MKKLNYLLLITLFLGSAQPPTHSVAVTEASRGCLSCLTRCFQRVRICSRVCSKEKYSLEEISRLADRSLSTVAGTGMSTLLVCYLLAALGIASPATCELSIATATVAGGLGGCFYGVYEIESAREKSKEEKRRDEKGA